MSKKEEQFLLVLTGPTAVGKTEIAINLSQELDGMIISADSRQVYKELSIGTAKPSPEEIEQGHMQLVDCISVTEPYSAGVFERAALEAIDQAHEQNKLPILCGGTGLYIKAVCEGLDVFPEVPPELAKSIREEVNSPKLNAVLKEIQLKDPTTFATIDKHNLHRVSRILGVIRHSGQPYSSFLNQPKEARRFTPIYVVLELPREELYERINNRVLQMVEKGLIEEVKALVPLKHLQALNTVGYSEVFKHLEGRLTIEQCISEIQKNSRRYAKRQMTWFRNQMQATYFSPENYNDIKDFIEKKLNDRKT